MVVWPVSRLSTMCPAPAPQFIFYNKRSSSHFLVLETTHPFRHIFLYLTWWREVVLSFFCTCHNERPVFLYWTKRGKVVPSQLFFRMQHNNIPPIIIIFIKLVIIDNFFSQKPGPEPSTWAWLVHSWSWGRYKLSQRPGFQAEPEL